MWAAARLLGLQRTSGHLARVPAYSGGESGTFCLICCMRTDDGLHRAAQGLKVAVVEGHDIGGTCVNRGCVPSKALLAASGRVRELRDTMHLKSMGIQVCGACCDRRCNPSRLSQNGSASHDTLASWSRYAAGCQSMWHTAAGQLIRK